MKNSGVQIHKGLEKQIGPTKIHKIIQNQTLAILTAHHHYKDV